MRRTLRWRVGGDKIDADSAARLMTVIGVCRLLIPRITLLGIGKHE